MASVDERVVSMTMRDNFVPVASRILQMITQLKNSLNSLKGSEKALDGLGAAGKRIDLSSIGKGIDNVVSKFGFLRVAAEAAFATIATRAVMAAGNLIKSFTIDPIIAGLHEYENELNTTAVIMANTGLSGEKGMAQIRTALGELNTYADKTIYSFEDMTSAIGKFTAAGVGLQDSVVAIKGLANLAALSGSSAQQAAVAQYQLSQAIATGTIRLMDWNSVVNAGMGGKVFQQSLIATARVHGVAVDDMIKKNGSFRDSLQEGWLTSKILLETLSKFTGDLGKEQLKSMGYTDKQIAQIQKQAQAAVDAATKVRTFTQLISTVGEAVQSAWANVWRAVFGNMQQATQLWTGIGNALSKVFVAPINNMAKLASEWSKLGGRAILINAISDAFRNLGSIMKAIGSAFRDVFPPTTAQRLVDMTKGFHDFVNMLKPSASALQAIHSIFEGLFSGIKIGMDVFKGVISVIGQMIKALFPAGATIGGLAAKFGNFVSNLRKSIETGTGFTNFFRTLGTILSAPVKVISSIIQLLGNLASGFGKAISALAPFAEKFASWFSNLGSIIADAIRSGDFSQVMTTINSVLMGGVLLAVRKFISNFGKSLGGGFGFVDTIKSIFGGLTSTLQALQTNLNAGTLRKIAIALAILTASIVALSLVNAGSLAKSLSAMTVMFTQLVAAMAVLSKISPAGIFQMAALGAGLNALASAILILSAAVAVLSRFSLLELAKGIGAIAVMMGILVVAVNLLSKNTAGVVSSSFAMILMAGALNLMATAIRILAGLDWGSLFKGVATIAALMVIMGAFNKFGGTQIISTAAAMLVLGAALNVIALAVKQLGSLSIGSLAKGLISIAAGLVIIALGMSLMPPTMLATAAGLLVVSAALVILSKALNSMGGMGWGEIAKSLVLLAGSLLILAIAVNAMSSAIVGAAALMVVAAALAVLTPVLMALGAMSWGSLLTSLAALAAVFLLLGVAGVLLTPLAPTLVAIGAAMLLFGAGVLAVGAGVALLGTGLIALGTALQVSGAAILTFVTGLLNLIPTVFAKIGEGIVQFAAAIAKGSGAIIAAFTTILTALLTAVIKVMPLIGTALGKILQLMCNLIIQYSPKIINAMVVLIMALLNAIASHIGQFIQKGTDIIVGFLNGIARNMGRVIKAGVDVVVAFINGISANVGRVIDAGVKLVISCINGMAGAIRNNAGALRSAAWNLGGAIIDGITGGLWSKAGAAISAASSIASQIIGALGKAIKFFSPSHETWPMGESLADGLAFGMLSRVPAMNAAAEEAARAMLKTLQGNLSGPNTAIGELNPVVTPVLDLTEARKGFDDLAAMAKAQLIPVTTASTASAISTTGVGPGSEGTVVVAGGTNVTFNQTNTSPKALSSAEIYRQTKNQLSVMRGALPA